MLPIISLLGVECSGKSTLGFMLAEKFNLYHLCVFEFLRSKSEPPHPQSSDDDISELENGAVLSHPYSQTWIPTEVVIYDYLARGEIPPLSVVLPLLCEEMKRISQQGKYKAILLEGFPFTLKSYFDVKESTPDALPKYVIHVDCPDEVARARFMLHTSSDEDIESFERRALHYRIDMYMLIDWLRFTDSPVVPVTNDGSKPIDQVYSGLAKTLYKEWVWSHMIVGGIYRPDGYFPDLCPNPNEDLGENEDPCESPDLCGSPGLCEISDLSENEDSSEDLDENEDSSEDLSEEFLHLTTTSERNTSHSSSV
ncbi:hypothetical protein F4677DRAFT_32022 [Hypoxylon crocopeplum]|nr:hypothetical protein F4677DRAFT_32022 [Hypoxylon crocopeplum]